MLMSLLYKTHTGSHNIHFVIAVKQHNKTKIKKKENSSTIYSRWSFYYMGAKLYNDLPLQIRKTDNYDSFDNLFDGQFLTLYIHILFNQSSLNV